MRDPRFTALLEQVHKTPEITVKKEIVEKVAHGLISSLMRIRMEMIRVTVITNTFKKFFFPKNRLTSTLGKLEKNFRLIYLAFLKPKNAVLNSVFLPI